MSKLNYKLINLALIAITIYFVYKTGNLWTGVTTKIVKIFLPFLFAFALAYALHPFLQKMRTNTIEIDLDNPLLGLHRGGRCVFECYYNDDLSKSISECNLDND